MTTDRLGFDADQYLAAAIVTDRYTNAAGTLPATKESVLTFVADALADAGETESEVLLRAPLQLVESYLNRDFGSYFDGGQYCLATANIIADIVGRTRGAMLEWMWDGRLPIPDLVDGEWVADWNQIEGLLDQNPEYFAPPPEVLVPSDKTVTGWGVYRSLGVVYAATPCCGAPVESDGPRVGEDLFCDECGSPVEPPARPCAIDVATTPEAREVEGLVAAWTGQVGAARLVLGRIGALR